MYVEYGDASLLVELFIERFVNVLLLGFVIVVVRVVKAPTISRHCRVSDAFRCKQHGSLRVLVLHYFAAEI